MDMPSLRREALHSDAVTISSSGLFTTTTNYTQTAGSTFVNGTLTATGNAIEDIQRGSLAGTGTINDNVALGGTIMPGAPSAPGTLTIFGNYERTRTGILEELIVSQTNAETKQVSNILVKDDKELHEPDCIYINPNQIVFVETVGTNSSVAQHIAQASR
jgi:hypothetical protein